MQGESVCQTEKIGKAIGSDELRELFCAMVESAFYDLTDRNESIRLDALDFICNEGRGEELMSSHGINLPWNQLRKKAKSIFYS